MSPRRYDAEYVPMIERLANREWYTARMSACALSPRSYPRMNDVDRTACLSTYAMLCDDDAPMVRRVASRNLGALVQAVVETVGPSFLLLDEKDDGGDDNMDDGDGDDDTGRPRSRPSRRKVVTASTFVDLYENLAGSDQPDSVRLHTTQNCVCFGRAMSRARDAAVASSSGEETMRSSGEEEEAKSRIDSLVSRVLPLVASTIDDRSWRVRWTAASKFADVAKAFAPLSGAMDALVPAYEKLLQDPEAEVRTAAAYNLSEVAKIDAKVYPPGYSGDDGSDDDERRQEQRRHGRGRIPVAERLVHRVSALTEDDSENVRAALAVVATDLAPALGRDATIAHLLPPMLLLLRDSTSEVRLNVVSSLSLLNDVVGPELLAQSLLPAILDLAGDGKWRIRLAVVERVPLLARQLGEEFFTDRLLSLCVGWLGDDISSIREGAAKALRDMTELLGSEWSARNLAPRVREVATTHPSYLRRTNAVRALSLMATAMDGKDAQREVLPVLIDMFADPVPNVRFNVAKGLGMVGPILDASVYRLQIGPILEIMRGDDDRDVRHFAGLSSDALWAKFEGCVE